MINNPLNKTDPTGYVFVAIGAFIAANIGTAVTAAIVAFSVTTFFSLAQGASLGQALSAGFRSGLTAFAGAFITAGLTSLFDGYLLGPALANNISGGITNVLSGGSFGDGFISSEVSSFLGGTKIFQSIQKSAGPILSSALPVSYTHLTLPTIYSV